MLPLITKKRSVKRANIYKIYYREPYKHISTKEFILNCSNLSQPLKFFPRFHFLLIRRNEDLDFPSLFVTREMENKIVKILVIIIQNFSSLKKRISITISFKRIIFLIILSRNTGHSPDCFKVR